MNSGHCLWRKSTPFCVSLLWVLLVLFWHSQQIYGSFPHTKQFCGTRQVSYNLTQFTHYLCGNSFRSQKLRTQPHKTVSPPNFKGILHATIVSCASDPLAVNQRLLWPPPRGSIHLLREADRTQAGVSLTSFWCILKGWSSGRAGWKKVQGEGTEALYLHSFTSPGTIHTHPLGLEASLCGHG